jgi:hypothetical protein
MREKTPNWEDELWSYLSMGDGINCPVYDSCMLRLNGIWCISDHEDYYEESNRLIDNDDPDIDYSTHVEFKSHRCPRSGRIFQLVSRLAYSYHIEAGVEHLPVPANLITRAYDNSPIEVRYVPLKAYHGAVWRLRDCWLVHLNRSDTRARQRFTLYHEIFHILAHCKATPVFKTAAYSHKGTFNELLADHFAARILLPEKLVKKKWAEVNDISEMAALFDVPKSVSYFCLKAMGLE